MSSIDVVLVVLLITLLVTNSVHQVNVLIDDCGIFSAGFCSLSGLLIFDLLEFYCCLANMEIKPKVKEHHALVGRLFY